MGIFGNKKLRGTNLNDAEKSQYERQLEERGPNLKSYEDDPLLNMEPMFVDSMAPSKLNKVNTITNNSDISDTEASAKIKAAIAKNIEKKPSIVSGPLGNIIGNARKASEKISQDVVDNDPVIAKLKKIDDLLRKGGTDQSLYTDVKKSQVGYYAQRAKDFAEQNTSKKLMSDEERLVKLAEETKNRGVNNYTPNASDYTDSIRQRVNISRNVEQNEVEPNEIKKRAMSLVEQAENDVAKRKVKPITKEIINRNVEENSLKEKKYSDIEIEKLEQQIKLKMAKIQKYRDSLIKKEEKMVNLIEESKDKKQTQKMAKFLEAKTIELEDNMKILEKQEIELEKTIAELKGMILPRRLKK